MTTYVVEYCYCAIAFLLVILWNCCTTRQFPSLAYRVFFTELICALIDVIADVLGAYTIPRALELPVWINHVVNTTYYVLQLMIPSLLLLYVLALEGFRARNVPLWMFLPVGVAEIIVFTNPLHGMMFHIDPALGYQRGAFFPWVYGCCIMYILLALLMLNLYRKRVNRKQYLTITLFIALVISAATVQVFLPNLLLSGPAIAISITMLYLTIQKPDDMLDVTTGVFNRTALMRMVNSYIVEKRPFQATLLVLGNFSRLDSIMGYESLNRLMKEIGQYLTVTFPRGWAFRLSGSTLFVVLTRREEDYRIVNERIYERFQQPWLTDEYDITLQATVLGMPNGELARTADEFSKIISYAADHTDEDGQELLGKEALDKIARRAEVEKALATALKQDLFEIYLQPIYDVHEQCFSHAEALLRLTWRGERIPPSEFIPDAEQNGMIVQLDTFVLRKVCRLLHASRDCGGSTLRCIGVNLSAVEFLRSDLADEVLRIVNEYGIDPASIALEMTETTASGTQLETREQIDRLKAEGFTIALDDFGTGFANITQVVQLPFDIVKLDRSILVGSASGETGEAVLRNCIRMFQEMGVRVIAEGAETVDIVSRLIAMGVDFIQGYYFVAPMPAIDVNAFLAKEIRSLEG